MSKRSVYVIGENIRKLRMEKFAESQEKFSERIKTTSRTVYNLECGSSVPTVKTLIKIADAADVTLDSLVTK